MTQFDGSARRMRSVIKRYGLSVLFVAISTSVTLMLQPSARVTPLFFLAILLSAWVGGVGPGLLAAMLATLAVDYFFLPQTYSLDLTPPICLTFSSSSCPLCSSVRGVLPANARRQRSSERVMNWRPRSKSGPQSFVRVTSNYGPR